MINHFYFYSYCYNDSNGNLMCIVVSTMKNFINL